MKSSRKQLLSIAVCTFNRKDQLSRMLTSLQQSESWLKKNAEVIVVDNCSTDGTADYVSSLKTSFDLKYFFESKPGLSNARNCALDNFLGDAIVFFDDDITVEQSALEAYFYALDSGSHFFAGPIAVAWQHGKPKWLKSDDLVLLNGLFGYYDLGLEQKNYDHSMPMPYGANFMLSRVLVNAIDKFNPRLGVIGDQIGRGEETDYFFRALKAGFNGTYLPKAHVKHHFQIERLNSPYLYNYGIAKGKAIPKVEGYRAFNSFYDHFVYLLKGMIQLLKGRRDRYYQCVINMGISKGKFILSKSMEND